MELSTFWFGQDLRGSWPVSKGKLRPEKSRDFCKVTQGISDRAGTGTRPLQSLASSPCVSTVGCKKLDWINLKLLTGSDLRLIDSSLNRDSSSDCAQLCSSLVSDGTTQLSGV